MAINKVVRTALKAISYADINVKKNYRIHRNIVNLTHRNINKFSGSSSDYKIYLENLVIPVRVYKPEIKSKSSVLMFFHGGGWVTGNVRTYDGVCSHLAEFTSSTVVSVDYRLAPEYPFPAALEDCYYATREFIMNKDYDYRDITIIGDSAGGNIAAALSLMARDKGEFSINKQILIYPSTFNDHSPNSPFSSIRDNGKNYLLTSKRVCDYMNLYVKEEKDLLNPYTAPLLSEDLSNQPKSLIITAEFCPLRDEGEAYGKKLREAGNYTEIYRIKDGLHGFFVLPPRFPQVKLCYDIINKFLCEVR